MKSTTAVREIIYQVYLNFFGALNQGTSYTGATPKNKSVGLVLVPPFFVRDTTKLNVASCFLSSLWQSEHSTTPPTVKHNLQRHAFRDLLPRGERPRRVGFLRSSQSLHSQESLCLPRRSSRIRVSGSSEAAGVRTPDFRRLPFDSLPSSQRAMSSMLRALSHSSLVFLASVAKPFLADFRASSLSVPSSLGLSNSSDSKRWIAWSTLRDTSVSHHWYNKYAFVVACISFCSNTRRQK